MNISISSDKNGSTVFTLNGGSERSQQQFSVAPDGTITIIAPGPSNSNSSSYPDNSSSSSVDKRRGNSNTNTSSSSDVDEDSGSGYQEAKSTMMAPLFISPRRTAPPPVPIAVVERVEVAPRRSHRDSHRDGRDSHRDGHRDSHLNGKHRKDGKHHKDGHGRSHQKEYKERVVIRRDQAIMPIEREAFTTLPAPTSMPVRVRYDNDDDSRSDDDSSSRSSHSSSASSYDSRRRKDRRH